ncbi:MAG: GAF domain-containing protein, partial [Chloroflexi bacterium]|nr:GAF domain-containing protein [Chloroflexota bacterium]
PGWPRSRPSALLIAALLWSAITVAIFVFGGVQSLGLTSYIIVILVASLLLEKKGVNLFFALSILAGLAAVLAQVYRLLPPSPALPLPGWAIQTIMFIITAMLARLVVQNLTLMVNETRRNKQALERRAAQIQAAAEIAREASALREMGALLERTVALIPDRFGFDYAGVFLLDEKGEFAWLRAGSGDAGRQMLAAGHRLRVGEEGIVGFVAGRGEARVALDVGKDAVHFKNPWLPGTRSEMALPLKVHQRVIGVLDVQSDTAAAFDEGDIAILQTMADQLAIAYETARLFSATRRQLDELTLLQAVAAAGAQASSEYALIETATRLIGQTLKPDNYGLLLLDEKSGFLHAHPAYFERRGVTMAPIPLGWGVAGMVAAQGSPLRTGRVEGMHPEIHSALCVPLKAGDRLLGVINIEHTRPDVFSAEDERLLSALAEQLATAMVKIRLLEETQRQVNELALLLQSSAAVSASLDVQEVLGASARHIVSALGAEACTISLWRREKDTLQSVLEYSTGAERPAAAPPSLHDLPEFRRVLVERVPLAARVGDPFVSLALKMWLGAQGKKSILLTPLVARGQVIGAVELYSVESERDYAPSEVDLCQTMANHMAASLENARLYHEAQQRAAELADALEQLKELDRMKDHFIQNVSHELRTPLSIVRGYAELFERGELGDLEPPQQEPAAIIARRVRMLSRLVDDLTAILEVEARKTRREMLDLAQLTAAQVADFKNNLSQTGLTVVEEIDDNLPPIFGDPDLLVRVVDNLLSNAMKFTPQGGVITVRLRQQESHLVLEVADTGVGIPVDKLNRIFERFYQVDGSATRRFGGAGLGLALVKEVVESHGGSVSVQSQPGKGAAFFVRLPLADNVSWGIKD